MATPDILHLTGSGLTGEGYLANGSDSLYSSKDRQGFTKSDEGRWDFGRSVGSQTSYNQRSYPSASEALDAYIGDHVNNRSFEIKRKYAKDVEELLTSKYHDEVLGYSTKRKLASAEDLRRHLSIKRLVDESYEKLGDHPHQLTDLRNSRDNYRHLNGDAKSSTLSSGTWDSDRYGGGALGGGTGSMGSPRGTYADPLSKAKSQSEREADREYVNLSFDIAKNLSGMNQERSSVADSHRPLSPVNPYESSASRYNGYPDDTMSQLLSARKHAATANVPSWVEALDGGSDTLTTVTPGANSTIVTGFGQPSRSTNKAASTPSLPTKQNLSSNAYLPTSQSTDPQQSSEQFLSTPKKQLRFDLNLTPVDNAPGAEIMPAGFKLRSVDTEDATQPNSASERLSAYTKGAVPSSPPKPSILKSPLKPGRAKNGEVSFTLEDINTGALQYGRSRDPQRSSRPKSHLRSFSASGRLSSTPNRSSDNLSPAFGERPFMNDISSVHGGSSASSVASSSVPGRYPYTKSSIKYDPVSDLYKVDVPKSKHDRFESQNGFLEKDTPKESKLDLESKNYGAKPKTYLQENKPKTYLQEEPKNYGAKAKTYLQEDKPVASYSLKNPTEKILTDKVDRDLSSLKNEAASEKKYFGKPPIHPSTSQPSEAAKKKLESRNGTREPSRKSQPEPQKSTAPAPVETPKDSGSQEPDISSTHKQYLRGLVQDIEDGSSSIITGLTDLKEQLYPSVGKKWRSPYDDLDSVLGGPPRLSPPLCSPDIDGLRTPSETSDIPLRASGLESNLDSDLDGDRPWETGVPPFNPREHTAIPHSAHQRQDFHHKKGGIVDKFLQECLELQSETDQGKEVLSKSGSNSGAGSPKRGEPPGTMEALKNMLFTMQSMTSIEELLGPPKHRLGNDDEGPTEADTTVMEQISKAADEALSPYTKRLLDSQQGGDSLERAMKHLDRLKSMVKTKKDSAK